MDDGQKTPRGHPDFNFYMKILRVFIFQMEGQMNRRMDRQTDRERNLSGLGWVTQSVPPGTPAARGLEELFSVVLERFLIPIHTLRVYC
jgi:hypothetical protein